MALDRSVRAELRLDASDRDADDVASIARHKAVAARVCDPPNRRERAVIPGMQCGGQAANRRNKRRGIAQALGKDKLDGARHGAPSKEHIAPDDALPLANNKTSWNGVPNRSASG